MSMQSTTYISYQQVMIEYLEKNNISFNQPLTSEICDALFQAIVYNDHSGRTRNVGHNIEISEEPPSDVERFMSKYCNTKQIYTLKYDTTIITRLFDLFKMQPEKMFNPDEETAYDYVKKYLFPLIPSAVEYSLSQQSMVKCGFRKIAHIFFTVLNIMEVKHHHGMLNYNQLYQHMKLDEKTMLRYLDELHQQKIHDATSKPLKISDDQNKARLLKGQSCIKQFLLNYQQEFGREIRLQHMIQMFAPETLSMNILSKGALKCPVVISKKYLQKIAALILFLQEEMTHLSSSFFKEVYSLYIGGNISKDLYQVHMSRLQDDPEVQKYKEKCSLAYSILPKQNLITEDECYALSNNIFKFIQKEPEQSNEIELII